MFKRLHITILAATVTGLLASVSPLIAQDEPYAPDIDPANFVEGVDNPYFPLVPGTTFIYEGETKEGTERIEVTVTPETKQVLGIPCIVVRDTVWVDGDLVEDTYDWYAQDKDGNVWYMGEDTKEYEDGAVVSTGGSWEAGVDGAQLGIIMEADPQVGDSYRQEYYAGEAEDMAEVLSLTESASVPFGSFDNLLMTNEWTPLEPGIAEHKYYAAGVGNVLEVQVEGGSDRVELIEIISNSSADEGNRCGTVPAGWTTYILEAGDTLSGIAVRTDSSADAIAAANCIENRSLVVTGTEIFVPRTPDPRPVIAATESVIATPVDTGATAVPGCPLDEDGEPDCGGD